MENMQIYEAVRKVPKEAQKEFNNGSFSGTDINPMWRIKTLTEQFGPCGIGWYYEVLSERSEEHHDITMAIVDLNLYIKVDGEWSKPIYGTGGNKLVQPTKNGPKASDEGYKMALTDALSVACKALGIGADVYWDKDKTKYTAEGSQNAPESTKASKTSKNTTEETKSQGSQPAAKIEASASPDDVAIARLHQLEVAIEGTGANIDAIVSWAQKKIHKSIKVATDEEFQSILNTIEARKAKNNE